MKPTMAIKPLVFALAAVMAVAAHSQERGDKDRHDHDPSPVVTPVVAAGSLAAVIDSQNSYGNMTLNQGTQDSAKVDASGSNSNGNLGINAAAGSANQQDNAAAIATADQAFIFGSAAAVTSATQNNYNNATANWGSHTTSTLSNSANTSSGNIGINVTSGDYNQQKNNLAIAVSGGHVAGAGATANQTSNNTTVNNYADRTYTTTTLKSTIAVTGSYKGTGTGTVADNDNRGDRDDRNNTNKLAFTESGNVVLSGVATWQVMTPSGWANPVMNSATLSNSLNNVSGNVGANVSAGTGNQQSNSLAIAAGCKTCM